MAGPKGDLPLRGIGVLAVLPVPGQGHSPGGKLSADLVGAAGLQADLHQGEALAVVQQLIVEDGLLDALAGDLGHVGFAGLFVAAQKVYIRPLVVLGPPVDHRLVLLQKGVLPDLPGELRGRRPRQAVDHQAAHHLVQPVDRPDLGVGLAQGLPNQVGHAPGLVGRDHPKGLDADHDGLVLIDDVQHGSSYSGAAGAAGRWFFSWRRQSRL